VDSNIKLTREDVKIIIITIMMMITTIISSSIVVVIVLNKGRERERGTQRQSLCAITPR